MFNKIAVQQRLSQVFSLFILCLIFHESNIYYRLHDNERHIDIFITLINTVIAQDD